MTSNYKGRSGLARLDFTERRQRKASRQRKAAKRERKYARQHARVGAYGLSRRYSRHANTESGHGLLGLFG